MRDPRPHVGEPLALDLLNTRWMTASGLQDLLIDADGLRCWLTVSGIDQRCRVDENTRQATVLAREAIRRVAAGESITELNAVLDHGRIRRLLTTSGPDDVVEVTQPEWLPGWLAANNLLHLLDDGPQRIRQCAHPQCVLWFFDTSKNGTRRWHSMAACGNRLKAARHHASRKVSNPDQPA